MFKREDDMELPKRKYTKADLFVFAVLLVVLLVFLLRTAAAPDADSFTVQTADGTSTYSLSGSGSLCCMSNGIEIEIRYGGGEVFVAQSGCPDGICVNTGAISKAGESIVCVPAQLVISIPHGDMGENHEDFIIG